MWNVIVSILIFAFMTVFNMVHVLCVFCMHGSRNFRKGGGEGGGLGSPDRKKLHCLKKALTRFLFCFCLVLIFNFLNSFREGSDYFPNANFPRNLSKLGFSRQGVPLSSLLIRACSAFTCSSDSLIDLYVVCVRAWWDMTKFSQASLVSQRCHLEQDTFTCILQPRKTRPDVTERLLPQIKQTKYIRAISR